VAGLHEYPLVFGGPRLGGGAGIGLVATLPSHRGRGHATALLRAALDAAEAEGRDRALLFSGIAPSFYERLGFRVVEAGGVKTTLGAELGEGEAAELLPLEPWRHLDRLVALYEGAHGDRLHLRRDRARWEASLHHNANNEYFLTDGPDAYVRVGEEDGGVELVELVAPPERRAALWRAVGRIAGKREPPSWGEPPDQRRAFSATVERTHQRPMVLRTSSAPSSSRSTAATRCRWCAGRPRSRARRSGRRTTFEGRHGGRPYEDPSPATRWTTTGSRLAATEMA